MEWYERWGVALAAFQDAATSAWDVIHAPFDDKPDDVGKMLGTLLRVPVGIGNAAFQLPAGVVQGAYQGYNAVAQPINDAIHHVVATPLVAQNLERSPTYRLERAQAGASGFGAATLLDSETWSRAWKEAEHISIGQALAFNGVGPAGLVGVPIVTQNATDVLNREEVDNLKQSVLFDAASGFSDAVVSWYADPVAGALKTVGAAKRVSQQYGMGSSPNDPWLERMLYNRTKLGTKLSPDELSQSEPVNEFLAWAQNRPAHEIIRHPIIARMANPDDAAGIFSTLIGRSGAGDMETARKVIAVGYGSKAAREELMSLNNDLSVQLTNIENLRNPTFLRALAEKNPELLYTDEYMQQYAKYEQDLAAGIERNPPSPRYLYPRKQLKKDLKEKTAFQKAVTAAVGEHEKASGIEGQMINLAPKAGMAKKAERLLAYDRNSFSQWNEAMFTKPFAPAVKIISWPGFKLAHQFTDKRPPSWIDPNRKEASAALWAYMRTSKIFDEAEMQGHIDQYYNALDISSRRNVIERIESTAIEKMARKAGLTVDQAKAIAKESLGRRNKIVASYHANRPNVEQRIYGVVGHTDEDGNILRLPAFETQEVNSIPLLDLEAYNRLFSKHASLLKAFGWSSGGIGTRQFVSDSLEVLLSVWSAANLLRAGYTIRNITDDTLRALASLGSLDLVGRLSAGVKNGLGNVPARVHNAGTRLVAYGDAIGIKRSMEKQGATPAEISKALALRVDQMGRDLHSLKLQSNDGFILDGHDYSAPYAGRAGTYHRVVGSNFDNIANTTRSLLAEFRNNHKQWETLKPGEDGHLDAWLHVINNQIGQSEIGKKFLEGMNAEEVKTWLRGTGEGRAALRKLGKHGKDVDGVVGRAQAITDYVVPLMRDMPDPFLLRKMAADGSVTRQDLESLFPDVDLRPVVHGPTVDFNLSTGMVFDKLNAIVDQGFKWFGSIPTDKLVRHPVFRSMYIGNVRRLHDNLKRQQGIEKFTDVDFARIEHAAREMSLKQLNGLLFDGSVKSSIAHKLRFMTGFFSAWEDSITKWAHIAYDKPEIFVNGMKLWNAPNQMNLGSTEDPVTKLRVPRWNVLKYNEETGEYDDFEGEWDPWNINDRDVVIQARLPEWLRKFIPFATEDDGSVNIAKSSLNLSLQGDPWWLPGAGPITNMAVGQYSLDHPTSLKQVYDWAIPFGAEEDVLYGLLPAWSRRLWDSGESITDGTRAQTFINITQTQTMKAKLGMRSLPKTQAEFYKEIEERTDQFFKLRAFTSFFSPVAMQYNSPFKPYIDFYRQLKAQESSVDVQKELALRESQPGHWVPVTADEQFLEKYGEDFYAFVTSISKNNLGQPASAEVWDRMPEVQKHLDEDKPELAALALGKIEDTKFNQYVYDAQFRKTIGGPGSAKTIREHQSPDEAIKANQIRLGWTKFTKMMDQIDGLQFDAGVDPEYIDKLRAAAGKFYAMKFPEWAKEYYEFDAEKMPRRIADFQRFLSENQREVQSRPDLMALSSYMVQRENFLDKLAARKANGGDGTLKAKSNEDLAQAWKNTQVGLAESNTIFGRVFWRYLSNDRLQLSALES